MISSLCFSFPVGQQPVDFQSGPDSRQISRVLRRFAERNSLFVHLSIDPARDGQRVGQRLSGLQPSDRAQLFAVGERFGRGQKHELFAAVQHADVEQPRRVQRRKQVERPPRGRLIRIDLREIAARLSGGQFHEAAIPLLADADADVLRAVGQMLDQLSFGPLAEHRHAGADVYQHGVLRGGGVPGRRGQGVFHVQRAD